MKRITLSRAQTHEQNVHELTAWLSAASSTIVTRQPVSRTLHCEHTGGSGMALLNGSTDQIADQASRHASPKP
jgi:hypothetical protein